MYNICVVTESKFYLCTVSLEIEPGMVTNYQIEINHNYTINRINCQLYEKSPMKQDFAWMIGSAMREKLNEAITLRAEKGFLDLKVEGLHL